MKTNKDLQDVAERFSRYLTDGIIDVYKSDYDWAESDAYVLACAYIKLRDTTLLADLTADQWRELGFYKDCNEWCHTSLNLKYIIEWRRLHLCHLWMDSIKTLGQLRHLITALEGV